MADLKISQLTSATLPLAGTEVLPIVQSSSTKKVATDDLTVKNVRSNATSGILQIAGPAAAATRTMTVPDANFTAARTDAANSFTGDQTLSTGNLIQGTAAKGVNFTANTPAAGMTSQLLNWYEAGTFTPTIVGSTGAGTATYNVQLGYYTRIGRVINFNIVLSYTGHTGTGNMRVSGLPFTSANRNADDSWQAICTPTSINFNGSFITGIVIPNSTQIYMYDAANAGGAYLAMDAAGVIRLTGHYEV